MYDSLSFCDYTENYFAQVLDMSQSLFKESSDADLTQMINEAFAKENHKIVLAIIENQAVGFVIGSIRTDYVEGARQSPTGYLEAIYIDTDYRKSGIAKSLVERIESWAKENGCVQLGSDTWLTDSNARNFHKKVGFMEEDELVHFIKDIR